MKNDKKAILLGAGAVLTYFFLKRKGEKEEKKEKKVNVPNLSIFPTEFYA